MLMHDILLEYRRDVTLKNLQPRLDTSAAREDISGEQALDALERMDPTRNQQYVPWLARQYAAQLFRTEDATRVNSLLRDYHGIKQRLPQEQRDINRFTLHQLEDLVDRIMHGETTEVANSREIPPDTRVLYNGPLGTLAVPETQAASCALGSGTRWCTAARENNMFQYYSSKGPLYVWIDRDGSKYQFHFETTQFMDAHDRSIDDDKLQYFVRKQPVTRKLFKQREEQILATRSPNAAVRWACDILHGRFEEAEHFILNNMSAAVDYAALVIGGPWPQLEEKIIERDEPHGVYDYAKRVLKERWPEVEPTILRSNQVTFWYAHDVIKGRWPEGEAKLIQPGRGDPLLAVRYARYIIRGRWKEAEPMIYSNRGAARMYEEFLNVR